MKKTDLDIRRERIALEMSGPLVGTGISVLAGGRSGPYTVQVERLSRESLDRVIAALLEATGRSRREG